MNNTANRSSDENNFRTSAPKKRRSGKRGGSSSGIPVKAIVLIAVAVLVLVAVVVALLIFAPSKNTKLQDNAYLLYTDADGVYHILSNGKVVEATFTGEVSLVPAKDLHLHM